MKVKDSDSLDNVPNENIVTLVSNQQTDGWLFATKNEW